MNLYCYDLHINKQYTMKIMNLKKMFITFTKYMKYYVNILF